MLSDMAYNGILSVLFNLWVHSICTFFPRTLLHAMCKKVNAIFSEMLVSTEVYLSKLISYFTECCVYSVYVGGGEFERMIWGAETTVDPSWCGPATLSMQRRTCIELLHF